MSAPTISPVSTPPLDFETNDLAVRGGKVAFPPIPGARAVPGSHDPSAPGFLELEAARAAGFTNAEIENYQHSQIQESLAAGFSPDDMAIHYGSLELDDSHLEAYAGRIVPELEEAGVLDAIRLGSQATIFGLLARKDLPEATLPQDAGFGLELLGGLTTLIGDLPFFLGAGAVAAETGPIGAAAAAFAVPAGIKQVLMDTYANGQIQDFDTLVDRLGNVLGVMAVEGTVGAATGGTGQLARLAGGKVIAKATAAGPIGPKTIAKTTAEKIALATGVGVAEVTAMLTTSSALHGEIPTAKDFALAAATVGVLHQGMKIKPIQRTRNALGDVMAKRATTRQDAIIAERLRTIYVRTGLTADKVIEAGIKDPTIIEDLGSYNISLPRSLEPLAVGPDPRLVRAAELVVKTQSPQVETLLEGIPGISRNQAKDMLSALEEVGIIGPETPWYRSDRAVLVSDPAAASKLVGRDAAFPPLLPPKPVSAAPAEPAPEAPAAPPPPAAPRAAEAAPPATISAAAKTQAVPNPKGGEPSMITSPDATSITAQTWYHGGPGVIEAPSSSFTKIDSLFGTGFYMTDSPTVAASYAKPSRKSKGSEGTVHSVSVDIKNPLDFDKQLPREAAEVISNNVYEEFKPVVDAAIADGKTGAGVWRALTEAVSESSNNESIPASEFAEMFQSLEGGLREAGYDGITHVGGVRAGKGTEVHRVLIALDPANELGVARVSLESQVKTITSYAAPAAPSAAEAAPPATGSPPAAEVAVSPKEPARFDEEALSEQILQVKILLRGRNAEKARARVELQNRLDALQERLKKEKEQAGSGGPSSEGVDAAEKVLSHVQVGDAADGPKLGWSLNRWNRFYMDWKDSNHPLRVLGRELEGGVDARPAIENEFKLASLYHGVRGKVDHFLYLGTFDYATLHKVGRPLREILKPVRKNVDLFRSYLVSKRRVELFERSKEKHGEQEALKIEKASGDVPIENARTVVKEFGPEFEAIAQEVYEYQAQVLKYALDGGLISAETHALMTEANKNYVPLFRVMEEGPTAGGARSGGKGLFRVNVDGSELLIHDPIESIIKNTDVLINMVERNTIADAYLNHVEKFASRDPSGKLTSEFAVRIQPKIKRHLLSADEMIKLAEKIKGGERLSETERETVDDEVFSIFRPERLLLERNQIVRFKNGEREIWEVPPEIAEVLQVVTPNEMSFLGKFFAGHASLLRAGAIDSPEFIAANPIRDTMVAFLQSDSGFTFAADSVWGAMAVLGRTDLYQKWQRSGGTQSELVALDRQYLGTPVERVTGQPVTRFLGSGRSGMLKGVHNVILSPVEALRVVSQISEQMTRVGEFGRALYPEKGTLGLAKETVTDIGLKLGEKTGLREGGIPDRTAGKAQMLEAGSRSRNVSLDFGRMGVRMQAVNRFVAFINSSLEGTDKTIRTFKDHPGRTMFRGAAMLSLPALYVAATNEGEYGWSDPILDEQGNPTGRYKKAGFIPQWQLDTTLVFPTYAEDEFGNILPAPDGSGRPLTIWHKIPMPWAYGMLFKTLPERSYNFVMNEDPKAYAGFMKELGRTFGFPFLPQGAILPLETISNKSVFTGAPIVPADLEKVLPQFQVAPRTTSVSRYIGEALSNLPMEASQLDLPVVGQLERSPLASPIVIDNAVKVLSGRLGQHFVRGLSRALEAAGVLKEPPLRRADEPADTVGFGAFAVRITGGQVGIEFWDRVQSNDQVHRTVDLLNKQFRPMEAYALMQEHVGTAYTRNPDGTAGLPIALPGFVDAIQNLTKAREAIDLDPGLSPDDRLRWDHELNSRKREIYQRALDIFDAMSDPREEQQMEAVK